MRLLRRYAFRNDMEVSCGKCKNGKEKRKGKFAKFKVEQQELEVENRRLAVSYGLLHIAYRSHYGQIISAEPFYVPAEILRL